MNYPSQRLSYLFGLLVILGLLAFSWYLQNVDGFNPCPLCILQRMDLILLGIIFFIGTFIPFKKMGQIIIGIFAFGTALLGILLSGRQVWLQHLPQTNAEGCGVSLNYLIQVLPPIEVIKKVFAGTAECSKRGWEFLHLSLAAWSLLWFGVFTGFCFAQLLRALKKQG